METLTLAVPEVKPTITTSDYHVVRLTMDWEAWLIGISLRGTNGELREFRYDGADAQTLMLALNKANLTVKSLQRRILEKLVADGKFAGAINGTPD